MNENYNRTCEDVHGLRKSAENLLMYTKDVLKNGCLFSWERMPGLCGEIKLETALDFFHVFLFMFIFMTWVK